MKRLEVTISGPPGCGKSTLARMLRDELRDRGIAVEVDDGQDMTTYPWNVARAGLRKLVRAVAEKSRVYVRTQGMREWRE